MKPLAVIIAVALFLGTATAQITTQRDTTSEEWRAVEDSPNFSCAYRAVEHLQAATDPNQSTQQDWHLKTAEAYRLLAEMGEKCA